MKISKQLIEKYHNHTCSEEESKFVEAWLINDEFDEDISSKKTQKQIDKVEIWQNISSFIDDNETPPHQNTIRKTKFTYLTKIAASIILFLTAGVCYYAFLAQTKEHQILVFSNSSDTEVKNIDYHNYSIAMAPKSNGKIDEQTDLLNFCGSLLLSPKNDIELAFNGMKGKIKLKAGQTYIVLSNQCPSDHPIIVNEKDVFNLPPVIQRQLTSQFSI